jgi:eukaryotic-like serine/threonine-protein kinase
MAMPEASRSDNEVPADLLLVLRRSRVLNEGKFEEVRGKVLRGEYPLDPSEMARLLVRDGVLTEYQARRLLSNRASGLIIGRYIVLDRIGSGSMGRVYKARHQMMEREVALKIIAPEIGNNERVVARFQREMKLVGMLDHPNVVRAFDADKDHGILYIAMEYVRGDSLGGRLRSRGPISAGDLVEYAAQAAAGLQHAHEKGIVHRDVKPSNLLIGTDGVVKVLDLGLGVLLEADENASFATADGIAVGTIDYMSPEQACGRDVDPRSDLFSLGCTMYHLLTGKLPFPGTAPVERLGARITGAHTPIRDIKPDVPSSLVKVMDILLANRPSDRYQTAGEAAEALRKLAGKAASAKAGSTKPKQGSGTTQPVVKIVEKEIEVRPDYPAWFAPWAHRAEISPGSLMGILVAFGLVWGLLFFALGFLVGRMG